MHALTFMCMLSKWVRNWFSCWMCASGTDAHPIAGHLLFNSGSDESSLDPPSKWLDNIFKHMLSMRALSVRVRKWCTLSASASEIKWRLASPKVKVPVTSLYFSPKVTNPESSVADPDPDPPDPRVFGPPGSGSTSQRYGSGSRSFYHHAKIARKTLIPTILWLFLNFYLWKMI